MTKKFIQLGAALVFSAALLIPVASASAAALTSSQINSIMGLLQAFGADQSVINNVSVALGGQGQASDLSCASFSDVSYGQFDNNPGGRVSQLQTWLGIPSSTFGFGTYGRRTQAVWNSRCGGIQPTNTALSATPTSGSAPLAVTFGAMSNDNTAQESVSNYSINFGDGVNGVMQQDGVTATDCVAGTTYCPDPQHMTVSHSYTSAGTYTATLWRNSLSPTDGSVGRAAPQNIGTATITVTGNSNPAAPTATIDQNSLVSTSATPLIRGQWTVAGPGRITITNAQGTTVYSATGESGSFQAVMSPVACINQPCTMTGGWTAQPPFTLPNGTYAVRLSNAVGATLVTGTLTVNANTSNSTVNVTGAPRPHVTFTYASLPTSDIQGIYLVNVTTGTNVTSMPTNGGTGMGSMLIPDSVPAGRYFLRVLAVTNNMTIVESAPFYLGAAVTTGASTLSLTAPNGNPSYHVGDSIPMNWNFSNVPASSHVVLKVTLLQASGSTGNLSGGTWQGLTSISVSGAGSYSWPTGSGHLDMPGTYSVTAVVRQCDSYGCSYYYPSDESLPVSATAATQTFTVSPASSDWPSLSFSPFIKAGSQGDSWAEGLDIDGLVIAIKNDSALTQQITFPTNCWYTYKIYNSNSGAMVFDLASQQQCVAPGTWPATTFMLNPGDNKDIDFKHQNSLFHLSPGSYVMKVDINSKNVVKDAVQFRFGVAATIAACPSNATAQRGQNGTQFACMCPANASAKAIYGTTTFTDNSDICTAGAWVGEMNLTSGGLVDYTVQPGLSSYTAGASPYGITSFPWGAWPGSFQITGPKG